MFKDYKSSIITEKIFKDFVKKEPYYEGRFDYYMEVIMKLHELNNINSVLEIGPYKLPFVIESDVMDFRNYVEDFPIKCGKFILHNCSKTPFPIEDKAYDLVIACQVIEHMGIYGQQVNFFNELERISNKALITLPYLWHSPLARDHHMINKKMINVWSGGRTPTFELISGAENTLRILQLYEFDK